MRSAQTQGVGKQSISGWEDLQNNIAKGKNRSPYNYLIENGVPPIYKQIGIQKYSGTPSLNSRDTYS